jgi:hypothetical protein
MNIGVQQYNILLLHFKLSNFYRKSVLSLWHYEPLSGKTVKFLGNAMVTIFYWWNSHKIFFSPNKKKKLNIFGLQNWAPPFLQSSKCKKKVYGSFLYQNWLSHLEKCQKLGMRFFFLSFANFFHLSDENLAWENELTFFHKFSKIRSKT